MSEVVHRRRRRHKGRLVPWLAVGLVVLVVAVAAVWLAVRAVDVRRHLTAARLEVAQLRDDVLHGQPISARVARIQSHAAAAMADTHDPVWFAASWLPPVRALRGLTDSVDQVATEVLPPLAGVAPSLAPDRLRPSPDVVDVDSLRRAQGALRQADA